MGLHPPVREDNCKAMQDQSDLGLLEEEWLAILGNISEDDKVGLARRFGARGAITSRLNLEQGSTSTS
jgi:hypothetical protein